MVKARWLSALAPLAMLTSPAASAFSFCVLCAVASVLSDSVTPWTVARQASRSMEFPRQEYWSGLLVPSPGDLSEPGMKATALKHSLRWQAGSLPLVPPGKLSIKEKT